MGYTLLITPKFIANGIFTAKGNLGAARLEISGLRKLMTRGRTGYWIVPQGPDSIFRKIHCHEMSTNSDNITGLRWVFTRCQIFVTCRWNYLLLCAKSRPIWTFKHPITGDRNLRYRIKGNFSVYGNGPHIAFWGPFYFFGLEIASIIKCKMKLHIHS